MSQAEDTPTLDAGALSLRLEGLRARLDDFRGRL